MSGASPPGDRTLRVAVVGAGPAGFYTADFLLRQHTLPNVNFEVDLFEKLPSPHGLVRSGVAPDHQSIKKVTKAFDRIVGHERARYLGNVAIGSDIQLSELLRHYDQVVYSTGAPTDRKLDVPGEDLPGSHPATAFVGWYNGHPDYVGERFDLSATRAVVVGLGNVAMDVARILIQKPEGLESTDIADYAFQALRRSRVREVVLLGRRSAAEAAFSPREIRDIDELEDVELVIDQPEATLALPAGSFSGDARKNVEFLQQVARRPSVEKPRRVRLRFLCSPVELCGQTRVESVRLEENRLLERDGRFSAQGTGRYQTLNSELVFRSIGYRGMPLPGLPFDDAQGVIPNDHGRVTESPGGPALPRLYVAGWIKRGPVGLIGANKTDAQETVEQMVADAASIERSQASPRDVVPNLLRARGVRVVSGDDWRRIDELEIANGERAGKARQKFQSAAAMLEALDVTNVPGELSGPAGELR